MATSSKKSKKKKEKADDEFICVDEKCTFKIRKNFKTPEEKVEDLKEAIKECGFKVEDKGDGEIKISE